MNRIIKAADAIYQYDKFIWSLYYVKWAKDKTYGFVFLKWDENKIIAKCAFIYNEKEKLFNEKLLNDWNNLSCENVLAPQIYINEAIKNIIKASFLNWFHFKVMINAAILNDAEYAPTLTTKQDRLPNAGIVFIDKENN